MCMCLVLFVVSEIPESSRLLSCFFCTRLELSVIYYLVCIKYYSNNYKYLVHLVYCSLQDVYASKYTFT